MSRLVERLTLRRTVRQSSLGDSRFIHYPPTECSVAQDDATPRVPPCDLARPGAFESRRPVRWRLTVAGSLTGHHDLAGLPALKQLAVIGNALPRRCGLATFTTDTVDALRKRFPAMRVDHYAMDDRTGVAYPEGITTIAVDDPAAYRETAGLIEASGAEAIWLQHEFGIFGGDAGSFILGLLERSTLPLVVTLHTILDQPSDSERQVFVKLLTRAAHLIVMAERGRAILREVYGIAETMISIIPHGAPDRAYVEPDAVKARFGLDGRKVVMTF